MANLKTTVDGTYLPDAPFPQEFIPASNFKVTSDIDHCNIHWLLVQDAYTAFFQSGGVTGGAGTLNAAINALDIATELQNINNKTGNFSSFGNGPGPRFGFCIGNRFKQHAYVRFDVMNQAGAQVILLYKGVELLENGSFKRIYVKEGEIVSYSLSKANNSEQTIDIGINKKVPPSKSIKASGTLKISNSAGKNISVDISGIKDNWDLIISTTGDVVPEPGDYYSLDATWCIEDPYLLTGYWSGTESEVGKSEVSGKNLYITEHNSPYEEGYFTGVYIWKKQVTTTVETTALTQVSQPMSGASMSEADGYEWTFVGFGNSAQYSDTYKDDTRYREEFGNAVSRTTSSEVDLANLLASVPPPEYLRIEIGKGGHYDRNNWHAPCLKDSYVEVNGSKFKILNHITADIIDLSTKSVDGITLSVGSNTNYSLLNQYAWMIAEDYYENPANFKRTGIMEGISSGGTGSVSISVSDPALSEKRKNGLSLMERYQTDVSLSGTLQKMFDKQDDWRLIDANDKQYPVKVATYSVKDDTGTYTIDVTLKNEKETIAAGQSLWFVFGEPFTPLRKNSGRKGGYSLNLTVQGSTDTTKINELVVSDKLCLTGTYESAAYKISGAGNSGTRVGICDGLLFGLGADGSAGNRMGVFMTLDAASFSKGIGSFFNTLRDEGWVAYKDPDTGKITIRRGLLDFKELPIKSEIVVGKSIAVSSVSGSPLVLDVSKERLRRLTIDLPVSVGNTPPAIIFGIGDQTTTYGFLISGDGLVDLQMLRLQGLAEGAVESTTYQDAKGNPVSPVYCYKRNQFNYDSTATVDIGIDTNQNIYVKDSAVKSDTTFGVSAVAEYINSNQALESKGLFDMVRRPNGEVFLIYGQEVGAFNVSNSDTLVGSGQLNNSDSNNTLWNNTNAVYIISTAYDGLYWGTPTKHIYGEADSLDKYQYPIMILNSVQYLSSFYDFLTDSLVVFVKSFASNGDAYVGCFTVSIQTLAHTLYACSDSEYKSSNPESYPLSFLYRPSLIESSFIEDPEKSWIQNSSDLIQSNFTLGTNSPISNESYVRVIGPKSTNSSIEYAGDFGMISPAILSDKTYVLFYNGLSGVQAIFSRDQGRNWIDSSIVLARNATNGMLLGDYLFYITSSGIAVKFVPMTVLLNTMKNSAGKTTANQENDIQKQFDDLDSKSISGPIDDQRLTGYISSEKYHRVFFYDSENRLSCVGTQDGVTWAVLDNF